MKKYFLQSQILFCMECGKTDLLTFFNEKWKCFAECKRCWFRKQIQVDASLHKKIKEYLSKYNSLSPKQEENGNQQKED